ncbi:tetratricopeptide repeat protein [Nonlabens sp.]|uniref:tetratricopeptide repeat protein n=1 Tax=Nonlabens sp. TaxID=1888209 RepID=UPI001BCD46CC|nr:tetratricopeptide repeat protein [Nonlabens sp.]
MKKALRILCLLFVFIANAQDSFELAAFAKANQAYTEENYDLAIAGYEQILKTSKHSAEVYFNLGNAYYKINAIGPAIYNYEKALQLDSENRDVINNLKFANQMKIDVIEATTTTGLESDVSRVITALSVDEWAYFSILILLFTVLVFLLYYYAQTTSKKRLFFILTFFGLLFLAISIAAAFYVKSSLNDQQYAIVYTAEFTTREEPREEAAPSFNLHEGTKVEVLEEFNQWALVLLSNGSKAWIPLDKIKKL